MAPDRRQFELRRIALAFRLHTGGPEAKINTLVKQLERAIAPNLSHTFRAGEMHSNTPKLSVENRQRIRSKFGR
jgi:hypothetical protein